MTATWDETWAGVAEAIRRDFDHRRRDKREQHGHRQQCLFDRCGDIDTH
jgi:hypothetical protein